MFRALIFCIASLFYYSTSLAQINEIDDRGRKQGVWKKHHPNGKLRYEGTFKDDMPVGEFKYYHETGQLAVTNTFYPGGRRAVSKAYDPAGTLIAEGIYQDQQKDSVWTYYQDSLRISLEIYDNGKKTGTWQTWHANGNLAEEVRFVNDIQQGEYFQYFQDSKPRMKAYYKDGELEGKYEQYWPSGQVQAAGLYQNSLKTSEWLSYNADGKIEYRERYENGERVEQQLVNGTQITYYANEIPMAEYKIAEGKKNGPFTEYYEAGTWKFREKPMEGGDPQQERYLDGQKIKVKGAYLDNRLHGIIIYYSPDGKEEKREKYELGRKKEL